jgi:catechol 2,3-dioxygenase-like lactoylglutathione lyase family enzyme
MNGVVSAAVPVCYVRNVEQAQAFYAMFGYTETQSGEENGGLWSYLQSGGHTLLLACVQPPVIQAELPLLIYLYVDDLAAVRERFDAAGHPVELIGHPSHAPGGEARTKDPDGNVVVFAQRTGTPADRARNTDEAARSTLIRQAAEAIGRRGGAPSACQVGLADGSPCEQPAEVKLADSWGETVWGCLGHTDEALLNARSAFIATEDDQGLGPWLRARRGHPDALPG